MAIYLIDGNSYVYRAFYAIRGLTDSSGRPTNAIFGFTSMLLKIIRERVPEGLLVSFDTPHPTGRHKLFEDYKAHRPDTPEELLQQLPHIKKIVQALGIKSFEVPGYEADDVLATLAEEAKGKGMRVYIVTGDKDMLQLVGGPVSVYDPMKDRELDEGYVLERFGVPPRRVTEYMALVGDPVDNIPGVKGVGEKTAKGLLAEFGSLEELMAHPERIKKDRVRKLITEGVEDMNLSRQLAEVDRQVPLETSEADFSLGEPDWEALGDIFRELEFTSLLKILPGRPAPGERECEAVFYKSRLREIISSIKGELALDTETTGTDPTVDRMVGFSLSTARGKACYVPLMHDYPGVPEQLDREAALDAVRPVIEDGETAKVGHNLKFDILVLRGEGLDTRGRLYDTMVASYLLGPTRPEHSLESVGLEHLSRKKRTFKEVVGKKGGFREVDIPTAADYACEDAELAFGLKEVLFQGLREEGLEELYFKVEMPLIYVLAEMEAAGVKVDTERLAALGKELDRELEGLRGRIFFLAGCEFNINSPKQLGKVLFEDLGLKPGKKKKTGYSTDMGVLEELARTHELPGEVLDYRSLSKLKNTYVDVLPARINPATGRLHTSFNQTVTATGRLSSSTPNLQNIPVRGEWGGRIRESFIAEEGSVIISADYSQIELRILAHLSEDPALLEAFIRGVDVHTRTAMEIFDISGEEGVSADMRRVAKTVNFGVLYGMSPFGLSEALGISRQEAAGFIDRYFQRHPGVEAYVGRVLEEARKTGHVRTIMGRKRPVPEIRSRNANTRLLGERLAVNSPIQGTAADIIKVAMINVSDRLRESGHAAMMILQVHDELLLESPVQEAPGVSELLREGMQGAIRLKVPLHVEVGIGGSWAEAH
jgi:DNA polymerase-1